MSLRFKNNIYNNNIYQSDSFINKYFTNQIFNNYSSNINTTKLLKNKYEIPNNYYKILIIQLDLTKLTTNLDEKSIDFNINEIIEYLSYIHFARIPLNIFKSSEKNLNYLKKIEWMYISKEKNNYDHIIDDHSDENNKFKFLNRTEIIMKKDKLINILNNLKLFVDLEYALYSENGKNIKSINNLDYFFNNSYNNTEHNGVIIYPCTTNKFYNCKQINCWNSLCVDVRRSIKKANNNNALNYIFSHINIHNLNNCEINKYLLLISFIEKLYSSYQINRYCIENYINPRVLFFNDTTKEKNNSNQNIIDNYLIISNQYIDNID
jgi:hypothetical protein